MSNRRPSMHHDYKGSFATEEVDQKLKKRIDGESLCLISDVPGIGSAQPVGVPHRCPVGCRGRKLL